MLVLKNQLQIFKCNWIYNNTFPMCVDIVTGCMGCLSLVNVHLEERYALPGVGIHLPRDAGMCVWCHDKKRELVPDLHYWSEPKETNKK